jgi:hypothetical protein
MSTQPGEEIAWLVYTYGVDILPTKKVWNRGTATTRTAVNATSPLPLPPPDDIAEVNAVSA